MHRTIKIQIKRAYEPAAPEDSERYLVDRLWPRGVKKAALRLAGWLKEIAPSTSLRRWFGQHPALWAEFRCRYREELKSHQATLKPLRDALKRGRVTLGFSARGDEQQLGSGAARVSCLQPPKKESGQPKEMKMKAEWMTRPPRPRESKLCGGWKTTSAIAASNTRCSSWSRRVHRKSTAGVDSVHAGGTEPSPFAARPMEARFEKTKARPPDRHSVEFSPGGLGQG